MRGEADLQKTGATSDIAVDTHKLVAAIVAAKAAARAGGARTTMNDGEDFKEIRELLALFRQWSKESPGRVRTLFQDRSVQEALATVGVHVTAVELHAPRAGARDAYGLGSTLCGISGRRHATLVTCRRCLARKSS